MKAITRVGILSLMLGITHLAQAAVGYINCPFLPGYSLFGNPLDYGDNTLGTIFYGVPEGTVVSLWNPGTLSFDTGSTYESGAWTVNLTLEPGTGARLYAPSLFTNTFVGTVLNHDGAVWTEPPGLTSPPEYSGPDGIFSLADEAPLASTGADILLNVLGRLPNVGEQITLLDEVTQGYATSTYLGGGNWDIVPSWEPSDSAFFNIGPIPEPSATALGLLGLVLVRRIARRTQ
ncbi:MAG TPA: hypothetical protein PKI20_02040 [Verrucomicrobiota bacterium]|nr:hypothetical protein [Verrucomicrobiota bacterium]HQL77031.1 hypothetical protein [Verrucomicrobiota bacterium]